MPSTVVMTSVLKTADGKIRVRYSDHTELEFGSMAELEESIAELDSDVSFTHMLALGWIHARQPSLDNINPIKDKSFIFDLGSPNPIKVQ